MDQTSVESLLTSQGWIVTAKQIPSLRWHLTASEPVTKLPLLTAVSRDTAPDITALASAIVFEPAQKDAYSALNTDNRTNFGAALSRIIKDIRATANVNFDVETEPSSRVEIGRVPTSIYFEINIPDDNLSAETLRGATATIMRTAGEIAGCIGQFLTVDKRGSGALPETGKHDGPWLQVHFSPDPGPYMQFMLEFTELLSSGKPVGTEMFFGVRADTGISMFASPGVSEAEADLFKKHGATETAPPNLSGCKRLCDKADLRPLSQARPAANPSERPAPPPRLPIARLYKYMRREHSEALATMGVVRVGTLYDFRRKEHRQGIRDPKEGLKEIVYHIDEFYTGDAVGLEATEHGLALKQLGVLEGIVDPRKLYFKDFTHRARLQFPDCYVHCTSDQCSQGTMRQFEGADSCVEILDPDRLYHYLTETLSTIVGPVKFLDLCRVEYASRAEPWNGFDHGLAPVLLKDPSFAQQHECRAIWAAQTAPTTGFVDVIDSRLTGLCRIVTAIPD